MNDDLVVVVVSVRAEVLVPGQQLRNEQVLLQHEKRGQSFVSEWKLTADLLSVVDEDLYDGLDVGLPDGRHQVVPEGVGPVVGPQPRLVDIFGPDELLLVPPGGERAGLGGGV